MRSLQMAILQLVAAQVAGKASSFIGEIAHELDWTTQVPWRTPSLEQRRFDALRVLRQRPAIIEVAQLDPAGKEQLRISRLATDVVGRQTDLSQEVVFTEALANKTYYGPVYFRGNEGPHMTISRAGARPEAGVSVAGVNLKQMWDIVRSIKVGTSGLAYVVEEHGLLLAHPDISLVLNRTDMTRLPHVQAALAASGRPPAPPSDPSRDLQGREVLTAYAPVAPLKWLAFVELPTAELDALGR